MNSFSPTRAFAVLSKEFTELRRDRLSLALIVVLPIIQLLLFGYAINTEPRNLPTAALVQDHGPLARAALSALVNSGYLDVVETADSPAELEAALESGRVQFAVTIPADFSRRVVRGDKAQVLLDADATDPMAASGVAAAAAVLPFYALNRELTGALGAGAPAMPFEVVVHRRYNPEGESALNIVPGLLGVILTMTLVMLTAMAVTREFERGTMEGLLATPVMPIEVMVGKLGPYVLVGMVQTAVIVTLGRVLFDVPMNGSWWAFLAGVVLFVLGSLALGFLISTVVRSQLQSMQLTIFYFLPSVLISGFMFPYGGMPDWAQKIGALIPVTHFIRLVRGSLLKGLGLAELWPCLAALAAFLVVVTALAMLRYRTTLD